MASIVNDKLVVMEFPLEAGKEAKRNDIVRALLDKRADIENVFKNDEYLKIDLTLQEIIGIKSTASIGKIVVGDLPALSHVISNSERHQGNKILNLGNINEIFRHI